MNEQFLSEATLNIISTLLVLGAFAICVLYWLAYKMEQTDQLLSFTPMDTDPVPDHFQPRAEHISQVLAEVRSLRTPLKQYKNMEHAAQYKGHVLAREYPKPETDTTRGVADPYVPHVTGVRMP